MLQLHLTFCSALRFATLNFRTPLYSVQNLMYCGPTCVFFYLDKIIYPSPFTLNILAFIVLTKAVTGWSIFASGVDLGRSQVLSSPLDRC